MTSFPMIWLRVQPYGHLCLNTSAFIENIQLVEVLSWGRFVMVRYFPAVPKHNLGLVQTECKSKCFSLSVENHCERINSVSFPKVGQHLRPADSRGLVLNFRCESELQVSSHAATCREWSHLYWRISLIFSGALATWKNSAKDISHHFYGIEMTQGWIWTMQSATSDEWSWPFWVI